MQSHAHLDPRLVPSCLQDAGADPAELLALRAALASLLTGGIPSPFTSTIHGMAVTLEPAWDGIALSIDSAADLEPLLQRFRNPFDPGNQELLNADTVAALSDLDARLRSLNARLEDLRAGSIAITLPIANALIEFHNASISRVIHEEIAGLFSKPIHDRPVKILAGDFMLRQFPIPSKRTHRFMLCQALENVAMPDHAPKLAAFLADPLHASFHGKICDALAKTRHPDASKWIAAILAQNPADETRLCAIEALARLHAGDQAAIVRAQLDHQSADKEWTRVIRKAAQKALQKLPSQN